MDTAVSDPLVGRSVDGRYAVRSRIARGGMATVYLATDTRLERDVALKVMHGHLADDEQFTARFRREARSAARLSHPNVVAVYDQGNDGDTSYLAMEYVPGRTLRELLTQSGSLSVREATDVLEPVLDALGAAHRAGLVHRDVKPENVLISDDGRVKVADFGLARAASSTASGATQGMLIGTVAYLSPELVLRGVADARSDVYAAGVMLFEMLTGRQPFSGEVPIQVAYQHVNDDVPAPSEVVPGIPALVDGLVLRATSREPDERPDDAAELLALVRETRTALTDAELDAGAAPPPSGDDQPDDDGREAAGQHVPGRDADGEHGDDSDLVDTAGRTIALPLHGRAVDVDADARAVTSMLPVVRDDAVPVADPRTGDAGAGPGRGRRRAVLALVLLLVFAVTAGGTWWFLTSGPGAYTDTPAVAGQPLAEAQGTLATAGLAAEVTERFHDTVAEGTVIETDPGGGERVRKDGTVTLVVSAGPELFEVPELAGRAVEDARSELEGTGLEVGEVQEEYSEDVAKDLVISQSVAPGEMLRRGEPVDLVVSRGREPIEVPVVVERPRAEAEAAITEAGLQVGEVTRTTSEDVAEGAVVSQSPAEGTLFRGDTVSLVVSSGPPFVTVPELQGRQLDAATAQLQELGLRVQVERLFGGVFGTVRSIEPGAGTEVRKGSTVVLRVV